MAEECRYMKAPLLVMAMLMPMSICFAAAGTLAYSGMDGWGWFLLVGMLCGSISTKGI